MQRAPGVPRRARAPGGLRASHSARGLIETDDDLDVGEFGIATRMVQPARRRSPARRRRSPSPARRWSTASRCAADRGGLGRGARPRPRDGQRSTVNSEQHDVDERATLIGRSKECDIQMRRPERVAPPRRAPRRARPTGSSTSTRRTGWRSTGAGSSGRSWRAATGSPSARPSSCSGGIPRDPRRPIAVEEACSSSRSSSSCCCTCSSGGSCDARARDLRLPQESFILAPRQPGARGGSGARDRGRQAGRPEEPRARGGRRARARLGAADDRARRRRTTCRSTRTSTHRRATRASSRAATASGSRTSARRTARTSTGSGSTQPQRLTPGDIVRIGETELRYER